MTLEKISVADLARRYGLGPASASRWMRALPHFQVGRRRFTTEAWLASWAAARVKNPPAVKNFDPLEAAVMEQSLWRIARLVEAGELPGVGRFAELERRVAALEARGQQINGHGAPARDLAEAM